MLFTKRKLKNWAESHFENRAKVKGWKIMRRGWPDFLCFTPYGIIVVEVKKKPTHDLKASQKVVMRFLNSHGIRTFKYNPDSGLQELRFKVGKMTKEEFVE